MNAQQLHEHFREGVRLFNEGHYWHAHEHWEACWLASAEPDSTFYKGIIQTAAALVHWQKQNPRGLRLNYAKSRPKLIAVLPGRSSLDLPTLIAEMDRFVATDGHAPPPSLRFMSN
jgi:hypothetical protein